MSLKDTVLRRHGRRSFLLGGGALVASAAVPATAPIAATGERRLSFDQLHTGEKLDLTYWIEGAYVPDALTSINEILRDFRTSEVQAIDVRLLDLLHKLRGTLGSQEPFHVISGYRSPKTNAQLVSSGGGVAKKSLHMMGKAIDVRLPGRRLRDLHRAAVRLKRGGVGLYTRSRFVHLDVGRVRYW